MTADLPTLAEQALANLVDQFARPLDFLRELAQNSIDAGSPRIDVSVAWDPPRPGEEDGVLRISVDDHGEGMDEDVIDNQLTRLFASSKEHDLTKIGKFGIGFTSIFAIRPEAVLLRTGRQGEYWELLFHADRTFDKVRIEEPVSGTKITLFKRTPPDRVERLVEEIRFVLGYWCEHSDTPITFRDGTGPPAPRAGTGPPALRPGAGIDSEPAVEADDPFSAFADGSVAGPERIDRPLALDGVLEVRHEEPGIEVVAGFTETPRFGFYNGGLTLLVTQSLDALGEYAPRLGHVSFKVKHDRLEHTLTRDNVLQDENWDRAMQAVLRAREPLRQALLGRAREVAPTGEALGAWHARLAAECRTPDGAAFAKALRAVPLFRDVTGRVHALDALRKQQSGSGHVLVSPARSRLTDALEAQGLVVLADDPDTAALLAATEEAALFEFMRGSAQVKRAEDLFVLPSLVDERELEPIERRLVERTQDLLRFAVGLRIRAPGGRVLLRWAPGKDSVANRLTVKVGDFAATLLDHGRVASGATDVLALNGPPDGSVFLRPSPTTLRLPAFLSWRCLLVNRHHPLFRAQLLASVENPDLAAYALATALLHVEGRESEAAYRRMLEEIAVRVAP